MNNETINVNEESINETNLPYPVTDVVSGDRISRRASKAFSDLVGAPIEIRQGLGRMDGTPFDCMYSFFNANEPDYSSFPPYLHDVVMEEDSEVDNFFFALHEDQHDYRYHGHNWGGQWMLDHPRYVSTKNGVVIAESVSPYVKDDNEIDDYLYFMTTFLACIDMGSQGTLVALPPAVSLHNLGKSATFMIVYGEIPEDNMLHDFIIPIPPSPIRKLIRERFYLEDRSGDDLHDYVDCTGGVYAHKLEPIVHDFDGSILELDD